LGSSRTAATEEGDNGLFQPALQPFRIILGQDPLADGGRYLQAAETKHCQKGAPPH
jgi:hypothetical protein